MSVDTALVDAPSVTRRAALYRLEAKTIQVVRPLALPLLRVCLGLVFVWFGALKVLDATPVGDLVARTVPLFDRAWFVPMLGAIEVLLGLALIVGRALSMVCLVLVGHLCGTFLVLVMAPDVAFQGGNPLLLTTEGEFVVKNVVLISATIVLASHLRRPSSS